MLKGSQRKYLRGLAHGLRPQVQIGKEGVSPSVIEALERSLEAHELIKVQIMSERPERQAMSEKIEEQLSCGCVGLIGKMAILYREHPDPEKRKIKIPA